MTSEIVGFGQHAEIPMFRVRSLQWWYGIRFCLSDRR